MRGAFLASLSAVAALVPLQAAAGGFYLYELSTPSVGLASVGYPDTYVNVVALNLRWLIE